MIAMKNSTSAAQAMGRHNGLAVIIPAGQVCDFSFPVIFDLYFRVDTQSKGSCLFQRCSFLRRCSASGLNQYAMRNEQTGPGKIELCTSGDPEIYLPLFETLMRQG